jgi:predicted Fe-S protein YdhL (DUF1289 family)
MEPGILPDGVGASLVSHGRPAYTRAMPPSSTFRLDGNNPAPLPRRPSRVIDLPAVAGTGALRRSTPDSPCVRNCCLDDKDMCLGCGRLLQEIRDWNRSSPQQRERTLLLARARLAAR